jgi:RNA polymerase subunit RPABC4/transcription elongation factor Spt4
MMDTTKRNKLARTIATMLCNSTTLVKHWRGGVDILYPFKSKTSKIRRLTISYHDSIKDYLIEYYGINDKIFTNKVTKEYIKQLNRKRRDLLGL